VNLNSMSLKVCPFRWALGLCSALALLLLLLKSGELSTALEYASSVIAALQTARHSSDVTVLAASMHNCIASGVCHCSTLQLVSSCETQRCLDQ
jgi:hypothetical protein